MVLAYYWDNKEELDTDMQRRLEKVERLRQQADDTNLTQKLRDRDLKQ